MYSLSRHQFVKPALIAFGLLGIKFVFISSAFALMLSSEPGAGTDDFSNSRFVASNAVTESDSAKAVHRYVSIANDKPVVQQGEVLAFAN